MFFQSRKDLASLDNKINRKGGGAQMLKTQLKVEAVYKPDIACLSDGEQRVFFERLLSRIVELYRTSLSQQD